MKSNANLVLGIDGGLANMGYALLELDGDVEKLLSVGIIQTSKSDKKLNIHSADDNARRLREVYKSLYNLFSLKPSVMCIESFTQLRNASSASKYAFSWSCAFTMANMYNIPVLQNSPSFIKNCCTGKRSASKEEVIESVEKKFGPIDWPKASTKKKSELLKEHPADALAVIWSCLDSQVIRIMRSKQ